MSLYPFFVKFTLLFLGLHWYVVTVQDTGISVHYAESIQLSEEH